MIVEDKPNPFQVLGLPTSASKKDIVDRGQELYDTAETEEQRLLYRWADASPIGLEDFDITALIRLLLQGMFTVPEIDIDDILKRSPFAPRSRPPLEVRDVIFG